MEQVCSLLACCGVALALLAYSFVCLWCFSVLALAVVALWFCTCLVFYLAQRFWHLWFIAFLLGFSLPPFPPGSVSYFYLLGSELGSGFVLCLIYCFSHQASSLSVTGAWVAGRAHGWIGWYQMVLNEKKPRL